MAISIIFLGQFPRFFCLLLCLEWEDDNYLFVLVSAFRSANLFPYALRFAFDFIEKRFLVFVQLNSFDQGRALFF